MEVDTLSASTRDSIVSACFDAPLQALGLTVVPPRRWIDGSRPPARRLFELHLTKGAGIRACWGFSLDFVPHIAAGKIRWHRNDKTALLDVLVEPKGFPEACYLFGAQRLASDLEVMLPRAIEDAQRIWANGATYPGMLAIIQRIRDHETNLWPYKNHKQMPLAFAFLCAKVGDMESASTALEEVISDHKLDEGEGAKLRDLLRSVAKQ